MKNKPVIIAATIFLLIFIALSTFLYHLYKLRPYLSISENPDVLKHFPAIFSYHDTNVSSYITQNYYPNNDTKEIIKKTESLFPTQKELFLPDSEKKIQPYIEEIVPNNLEKFVSSFIKYNIKHDIERSKNLKKELADYADVYVVTVIVSHSNHFAAGSCNRSLHLKSLVPQNLSRRAKTADTIFTILNDMSVKAKNFGIKAISYGNTIINNYLRVLFVSPANVYDDCKDDHKGSYAQSSEDNCQLVISDLFFIGWFIIGRPLTKIYPIYFFRI